MKISETKNVKLGDITNNAWVYIMKQGTLMLSFFNPRCSGKYSEKAEYVHGQNNKYISNTHIQQLRNLRHILSLGLLRFLADSVTTCM